jgi:hypothetical protein
LTGGTGASVPTATATSPLASPIDVNLDGTGESLDRDIGASSTDVPKAASGEFDSVTPVPEAFPMTAGSPENDGGLGTLTILGIVLGVLLAAALIGSIAASRLARKTP